MSMTYATVTGRIVIPGTTTGIPGELRATPLTDGAVLAFPANDYTTIGPAVADVAADGSLAPALQIPTDVPAGTLWRLVFHPKGKGNLPVRLGDYEITASCDIADLVAVNPTAITPTLAAKIAEGVAALSGEDTAVAFLVADAGSDTAAALSATIGTRVTPLQPGAQAALGLRASLDAGVTTGIALIGDSTGNDDNEWAREWVEALAAENPAYTVQEALWSDTAQDTPPATIIQTGTAGLQYLDTSTHTVNRQVALADSPHTPGVIDVRAKVRLPSWSAPAVSTIFLARNGDAPNRSWYFYSNVGNGKLALSYSADGTTLVTKASSVGLTTPDNTIQWVRVVYTPSTDVKFYTSPDGVTWTQLGSTVAVTEGALYNAAAPYEMGGRGGAVSGTSHIFAVDIRDGLAGKPLVPRLPALWGSSQRLHAAVIGAPTLTLVNGSQPGADLAYWTTTRIQKALPKFGQAVAFVSLSHNELDWSGPNFIDRYAAKITDIKASLAGVPLIYLTQNPQTAPRSAALYGAQAIRRADIIKAAGKAGDPVIDTYGEFVRVGTATTIQSDGIHPTVAGSLLWRDTVRAATGI